MKKDYSVTSLAGALVWAAAEVLRRVLPSATGIVPLLINALPKFGVIWLMVGLMVVFWPYVLKKEFPPNLLYPMIGISLAPVLLYEILNPVLRGGSVYPWDIVASLVAACWLAAEHFLERRKAAAPSEAADIES